MHVQIGNSRFEATLVNQPAAEKFKALLPLTIRMKELNGNEKYFDLPKSLPTNATLPGTIKAGDVLLYGSKTIVVFYKTFSSSYSYTRLGRIEDPSQLEAALGEGDVTVTFAAD